MMIFKRIRSGSAALLLATFLANGKVHSETVTVSPVADTTLFETSADNNLGADRTLAAGTTAKNLRSRAVLKFDLAATIPTNATITGVSLRLRVTKGPAFSAVASTFNLRRVLVDWNEGAKTGLLGAPAAPGESTWRARMTPSPLWNEPGGAVGSDFASTVSATTEIDGTGAYTFESTPELVADAQFWLEQPDSNFGWVLSTEAEQTSSTARRFASREDAANPPALVVEYSTGSTALQITGIVADPPNVEITWTGGNPPFQLEGKTHLGEATWFKAGTVVSTNITRVPMDVPQTFFRVLEAR